MISFFLFGQSNMAGADAVATQPWLPEPSDKRSTLHRTALSAEPPVCSAPLAPYETKPGMLTHGPEVGFARELQRHVSDDYVFVKATGNVHPDLADYLWAIDKSYMETALSFYYALCTQPPAAILMSQGIDEALSETRWQNYRDNLLNLIRDLREHFKTPNLPFIVGQEVNSPLADPARMAIIREAQRQASIELPRVGFVQVDDLGPYVNRHHLTSAAQLEFGRRFVQELLRLS